MVSDCKKDVFQTIIADGGCRAKTTGDPCRDEPFDEVTADMTVARIMRHCPDCIKVLRRHGLNCCACVNSERDTVRSVARILDAPLAELLRELNVAARKYASNTARISLKEEG